MLNRPRAASALPDKCLTTKASTVLSAFEAEHVLESSICSSNIVQAVLCCFIYLFIYFGKKEATGKQSRAGEAESKQTGPQPPSLTFGGVRCSSPLRRHFGATVWQIPPLPPVAQRSKKCEQRGLRHTVESVSMTLGFTER